ncbi:uncharacterized protein LOC120332737 isoform X1 [Styela clava]
MATAVSESSLSAEISESLLQCPICHSAYVKPKVLSCQHSYCVKCLKGWLRTRSKKTNKVKCAVCRKLTVLPQQGVEGLPENYAIKGLLAMLKHREKEVKSDKVTTSKKGLVKPATKTTLKAKPKTAAPTSSKEIAKKVAEMMSSKCNAEPKKAASSNAEKGKKTAASAKRQDKNANVMRQEKKTAEEKQQTSSSDTSSSDEEDSSDSSDYSSSDEESEDGSCSSYDSDDSYSDSYESSDDKDVPPTPTIKMYGEIKVGVEVYVFNRRGKKFPGVVKLLESCQLKHLTQPRMFAGVELEKKNSSLITEDIDDIDDSYLSFWLEENGNPRTVVRADDCFPVSLVNSLMDFK